MHKELIICIIIILIVVATNAITQNYTKESVRVMDENLDKLEVALKEEEKDEEKLQQNLDDVMGKWRERYEMLAFFIEHDELEKVETELTSLKAEIDRAIYTLIQQYADWQEKIKSLAEIGTRSGIEKEVKKIEIETEKLSKELSLSEEEETRVPPLFPYACKEKLL